MPTEQILKKDDLKELFLAFSKIKNEKESKKFLRDICSLAELNAMSERLQIVKMIRQKIPYREISKITGASTTTVTRVAHWYNKGLGGYKLILNRMGKKSKKSEP